MKRKSKKEVTDFFKLVSIDAPPDTAQRIAYYIFIYMEDADVVYQGLQSFLSFTSDPKTSENFIDQGVGHMIIKVLQEYRENTKVLVSALSCIPKIRSKLSIFTQNGAGNEILHIFEAHLEDPQVLFPTILALKRLCEAKLAVKYFFDMRIGLYMVKILSHHSNNTDIITQICRILWIFLKTDNSELVTELYYDGVAHFVLKPLILYTEEIKSSNNVIPDSVFDEKVALDIEFLKFTTGAIWSFSKCNQYSMMNLGAHQVTLDVLRLISSQMGQLHEVFRYCMGTIHQLSLLDFNAQVLVAFKADEKVVEIMTNYTADLEHKQDRKYMDVLVFGCKVLTKLSSVHRNRKRLNVLNMVKFLAQILRDLQPNNKRGFEHALNVLNNMYKCEKGPALISQLGCINHVIKAGQRFAKDPKLMRKIVFSLSSFVKSGKDHLQLVQSSGGYDIVQDVFERYPEDENLRDACTLFFKRYEEM